MDSAQALEASATLCLGAAASGTLPALLADPALGATLARHREKLDVLLRFLQHPIRAAAILRAQVALALCLPVLGTLSGSLVPLLLLPAVTFGPGLWLELKAAQRTTRIEQQLHTLLTTLSNTLYANPSLGEALSSSASLVGGPLAAEIGLCLKAQRLGTPLDQALQSMADRVGSVVVSSAVMTLRIARNSGGNLSKTLETTAASLREMARLEGVIRTKTAEGRAQSALISVVPAGLIWMLDRLDPQLLQPLLETTRGHLILALAAVLWLAALLWAWRIVRIDI